MQRLGAFLVCICLKSVRPFEVVAGAGTGCLQVASALKPLYPVVLAEVQLCKLRASVLEAA